ncbi:MAG TPA: ABC transporter ATP-binding protein, partial [Archangium sp.]
MLRTFALSLIKPYRRSTLLVLALGLLASFLNAADPLVLKYLFDALGDRDAKAIPFALGALLVAELGRATLSGVVSVKSSDVRLAVERSLRERLVRKLTKASSRYHQANGAGATVSRVTQSVNAFTTAFGELMLNLLPSLAYLSIALIVMWRMNWKLAVVVLAFTPVAPLIGAWASREQATRERHLTHWWTRLHGRLNEVLAGMSVVKVFGMERTERERFVASQKEGHDIVSRGLRTDAITGSARTLAVSFARLGAIAVGVYLIFHHQLTAGSLVAFLAYVGGIVGPVQSLTTLYQTVRKGIVGVEMMREIIETPSE